MKLKVFKDIRIIEYRISALENQIQEATEQAEKCTAWLSQEPISTGKGYRNTKADVIYRIIELKKQLEEVTAEREKLFDAYYRIPDALAKEAIKIKYDLEHGGKHPISWTKTAFIIGGGNTGDSLRMYCTRAIKDL